MATMTRADALQQLGNHMIPPEMAKGLLHPLRFLVERPKKQLARVVRPGDTVVELGCGSGYFTRYLSHMVGAQGRVIAVDVQPDMLSVARAYINGKAGPGRIDYHLSANGTLGLELSNADTVVLIHTLHEAAGTETFLAETVALLRSSGRLLFMEPKIEVPPDLFAWEIKLLEEAGLTKESTFTSLFGRGAVFGKP
ncbi:methyltransferase domain-containing protein [bacterium]|nr:methyltransferase domain-containing protein [bacterium]